MSADWADMVETGPAHDPRVGDWKVNFARAVMPDGRVMMGVHMHGTDTPLEQRSWEGEDNENNAHYYSDDPFGELPRQAQRFADQIAPGREHYFDLSLSLAPFSCAGRNLNQELADLLQQLNDRR